MTQKLYELIVYYNVRVNDFFVWIAIATKVVPCLVRPLCSQNISDDVFGFCYLMQR